MGVSWWFYLLAGGISWVVAVAEIVTVFESNPVRALRTGGAVLLLMINAIFAVLVLTLIYTLFPDARSPLVALAVGIGLPILVRTRFTVFKPMPGTVGSEGIEVRLDEVYDRLQRFCRRIIDMALAAERVNLVDRAITEVEITELERRTRLLLEGGLVLAEPEKGREYVERILRADYTEDRKKMLLAFAILGSAGLLGVAYFLILGLPAPHLGPHGSWWESAAWVLGFGAGLGCWWRDLAKRAERGSP